MWLVNVILICFLVWQSLIGTSGGALVVNSSAPMSELLSLVRPFQEQQVRRPAWFLLHSGSLAQGL